MSQPIMTIHTGVDIGQPGSDRTVVLIDGKSVRRVNELIRTLEAPHTALGPLDLEDLGISPEEGEPSEEHKVWLAGELRRARAAALRMQHQDQTQTDQAGDGRAQAATTETP